MVVIFSGLTFFSVVMVDGYSAYDAARKELASVRDGPVFSIVHCWAHVRRKFKDCEGNHPDEVEEILKLIGELYKNDKKANAHTGAERLDALEGIRREESKLIIDAIKKWLMEGPVPYIRFYCSRGMHTMSTPQNIGT